MDTDFEPPRTDMLDAALDAAITGLCVAIGIGSVGIVIWLSVREIRQRIRYRGIGR